MQTEDEDFELQMKLAGQFRSMHSKDKFFVLPNAWDVPSARMFEEVGFASVATSSAGLSVSLGYQDGESIPKNEFMAAVKRISGVLSIPLSVDLVSGFGRNYEEIAASVTETIKAGAVGINIEDFDHRRGKLFGPEEQSEKIRAIRSVAENMAMPFVINARTDAVSSLETEGFESSLENAIYRSEKYIDAGADCVYPMGVADYDSISSFVKSVNFPVNLMVRKGLPEIKVLRELGVTRLSFGPAASYAAMGLLWRVGKDILERDSLEKLLEGAISFEMLNSLATKRK